IPDPGGPPELAIVVIGCTRTITLRHIPPRGAGAEPPQDAIGHPAVVHPRHAPHLVRQKRCDERPFLVAQFVTAHLSGSRFGSLNHDTLIHVNLWGHALGTTEAAGSPPMAPS